MEVSRTPGKHFENLPGYYFELHCAGLLDFEEAPCAFTSNSLSDTERIRARETERVLRKLDLSREQAEAVEHLSQSLVNRLIHGPIAGVAAVFERASRSVAGKEV